MPPWTRSQTHRSRAGGGEEDSRQALGPGSARGPDRAPVTGSLMHRQGPVKDDLSPEGRQTGHVSPGSAGHQEPGASSPLPQGPVPRQRGCDVSFLNTFSGCRNLKWSRLKKYSIK